jgi:hypothetical protein
VQILSHSSLCLQKGSEQQSWRVILTGFDRRGALLILPGVGSAKRKDPEPPQLVDIEVPSATCHYQNDRAHNHPWIPLLPRTLENQKKMKHK